MRPTSEKNQPKAFISHATADQARFVGGFARALTEQGVDVFYAGWDLAPGDDLVRRIFDEGLGDAATVIVVVSRNSIASAWVRAELNTAVVRNIERNVRIIPVLIDDCELPVALERFVWVRIANLENYSAEVERIAMALHGVTRSPGSGARPAYAQEGLPQFAGLSPVDGLLLNAILQLALDRSALTLAAADVLSAAQGIGISDERSTESIAILAEERLLDQLLLPNGALRAVSVLDRALLRWLPVRAPHLVRSVALAIENHELRDATAISTFLGEHLLLVFTALKELGLRRAVRLADTGDANAKYGRKIVVLETSPRLRRMLEDE